MTGESMKTKADISGKKPGRSKTPVKANSGVHIIRDAAWEAEKRWFEENSSLDPLALFAKYFQRLG
jgi:hypothetical protein